MTWPPIQLDIYIFKPTSTRHIKSSFLAAVVTRGLVPPSLPGLIFYVHACHPRGALPAPGLAGCPAGRGE